MWWKEVKKLSGMSSVSRDQDDVIKLLQHIEMSPNISNLANTINKAFVFPMSDFSPLPADFSPAQDASPSPPFVVSTYSVYRKLSSLKSTKAQGPDGVPAWLLKENADLLMEPVTDILNCSYLEACLPPSWKEADVVPIPKQKPIQDVNKHLRPISLTPILSKVAEEFIVETHVKPVLMRKIGDNQFGSVPRSSTTHALISMLHTWTKYTDGNGSTVRVVLFDYRKAFDLIDHSILAEKLMTLDLPHRIVCWIIDFLKSRKQRVKLAHDCKSEWREIPAGVPQGTKLGPWLFLLMIDDIDVTDSDLWKYVDDTTMAECVPKNHTRVCTQEPYQQYPGHRH